VIDDSDQRIMDRILQCVDLENKQVLEIGCGDGRITALLVGMTQELVAVEPDETSLRKARVNVPEATICLGSGEDLGFPDERFDVVIFTLSLHHQDSRKALKEAGRVLKDGGRVVIIEPRNEGEVAKVFGLLRNEAQATVEAQEAINECGLKLDASEEFEARWTYEDEEELIQSLFAYFHMEFDPDVAGQVSRLLGEKANMRPITLIDSMIIQSLKKESA